ncbi:MAG: hypothetical protein E6P95_04480 [Candidatus Moraniibacteriota bacterium]|nr:MAG: hypothetical protein E6P95_04480 [Candidatus Moranbacteria bacterium]
MLHKFPPRYFWVTTFALMIAAGLFWLGVFRQVVGEEDLLFLPKTDRTVAASSNAAILLESASFQERIEDDMMKQFPDSEKGSFVVQGTVLPGSSVLRLTTNGPEQLVTKTSLNITTKLLLQQLSQYYNFQTELDVRVIDGPRLGTVVSSWPLFLLATVATGLGVTIFFFFILAGLEGLLARVSARSNEALSPHISADTFRPQTITPYWSQGEEDARTVPLSDTEETHDVLAVSAEPEQPADVLEIETNDESYSDPNPAEVLVGLPDTLATSDDQGTVGQELPSTVQIVATGPAPDNLPVADLSPLEAATARLYKADIDATAEMMAEAGEASLSAPSATNTVGEPQTFEPSPDEYKRRLNELLSGKL